MQRHRVKSWSFLTAALTGVPLVWGSNAAAVDITRLVGELQPSSPTLPSEFSQLRSFSKIAGNANGGYVLRVHTGSSFGDNYGMNPAIAESFLIGSSVPVSSEPFFQQFKREDAARWLNNDPADDPPGVVVGGTTYYFTEFSSVDIDNAGNLAYGASLDDTPGDDILDFSDRISSIWFNDTLIAMEGGAISDPSLAGSTYLGTNIVGMGEAGGLVFRGTYDTPSGTGYALFRQDGTAFFRSGDAIGNTGTTIEFGSFAISNSAVSQDGLHVIASVDGDDGVDYLTVDGSAVTLLNSGQTYIPDNPIGLENGARTATEQLPDNFNSPAVGAGGNWGFTGFTDDPVGDPDGDFDSVAMINGYVTFRETDVVNDENGSPITLDSAGDQVLFNNDGDVLMVWNNALILNGTVIATEGTNIVNDPFNADLRLLQPGGSISERDANGDVVIYFEGRNDTPGPFQNADTIFTLTTAFDTGAVLGDMDVNGTVDLDDVVAFVTALESRYAYTGMYGSAVEARGDINGDGLFNLSDVEPFAALVGVPASSLLAAVPEPGVLAAMLGLLPMMAGRGRGRAGAN